MLFVIGIDNGLDGAVAILKENRDVEIIDTPTFKEKKKSGSKEHYDKALMIDTLQKYTSVDCLPPNKQGLSILTPEDQVFVFVEQAHPMKGKIGGGHGNPQSNFSTGFGFGLWQMALVALQISYQQIAARTWQNHFFKGVAGETTKQKSFLIANQLFPKYSLLFKGPKGAIKHGRTDALLIAEYGMRQVTGGNFKPDSEDETYETSD